MYRSPADKTFLKRMVLVILAAEIIVIGVCYAIFGEPYWLVMAIMCGSAIFAGVIGFSALFGPDYNAFSPWPSFLAHPLPPRGPEYPGYGPHEDPREREARRGEAEERKARDEAAATWLGLSKRTRSDKSEPVTSAQAYIAWTLGPLIAIIVVVAFLVWSGIDPAP